MGVFTPEILAPLGFAFAVWRSLWWLILPVLLAAAFAKVWMFYIRTLHLRSIRWINLEVRTPKDIEKTPKSMEQVFGAVYSIYSHGFRLSEIYWEGQLERWVSFELAASSAGVSFQIHLPEQYRSMIEAAIYAQYPDAEIEAVPDYTEFLPGVLPNKTYELWGGDYFLDESGAGKDGLPLRTYLYWEAPVPEEKVDTMAGILEVLSRLRDGEMIWFQILVRPTSGKWKGKAEKYRNELFASRFGRGKKPKKKSAPGWKSSLAEFLFNLIQAPFRSPEWGTAEETKDEEAEMARGRLTPGEEEILRGIDNKIAKIGFECDLRWLYIARRDIFAIGSIIPSMTSVFRQFNTQNMNSLRFLKKTITIARSPFKNWKVYSRKRRTYDLFRQRRFYTTRFDDFEGMFSILNIEELATLYHFPSAIVEAPLLHRVEARKGSPPAGLPVE